MSVLRHVEVTAIERAAYLRHAAQQRAALGDTLEAEGVEAEAEEIEAEEGVVTDDEAAVDYARLIELQAADQMIVTITDGGLGKRTSAYDYRLTGRGGQGLIAYDLSRRGGRVAASFPVEEGDELLLVTDAGQLIRTPASQVRIAARNTQGVYILRTADGERVVSVERLAEAGGGVEEDAEGGA